MTDGVLIKYSDLQAVSNSLKAIIEELNDASSRATALESAIGDPYGKNKLREAAEEFEDGWDDRRRGLKNDMTKVQEHVEGVLQGFEEWDLESSKDPE